MRVWLVQQWQTLRASYWFIPSLMALAAILLALGLVELSAWIGDDWVYRTGWLFANQPDGARGLLTAIAGSMITVAGVTFSITISTLAMTASQFGPRLLGNFMQDRGNQITLGTFIATFLYCLMVLRTVHGDIAPGDEVQSFVPHLAIMAALLFALASVAVLIYFIHHIPSSIHISNVIAHIGHELTRSATELFPEIGNASGQTAFVDRRDLEAKRRSAVPVLAPVAGYVQNVDVEELLEEAAKHELLLFMQSRPGDFVNTHDALVTAWPPDKLSDQACAAIRAGYAFGNQRTENQDWLFLLAQLTEIAIRALSPGVNDPYTAMDCLNWMSEPLTIMACREPPQRLRFDDRQVLRVVARPVDFADAVDAAFDALRPYLQGDRNAALHALTVLEKIGRATQNAEHRRLLVEHAELLSKGCGSALQHPADREAVVERCAAVAKALG